MSSIISANSKALIVEAVKQKTKLSPNDSLGYSLFGQILHNSQKSFQLVRSFLGLGQRQIFRFGHKKASAQNSQRKAAPKCLRDEFIVPCRSSPSQCEPFQKKQNLISQSQRRCSKFSDHSWKYLDIETKTYLW